MITGYDKRSKVAIHLRHGSKGILNTDFEPLHADETLVSLIIIESGCYMYMHNQ